MLLLQDFKVKWNQALLNCQQNTKKALVVLQGSWVTACWSLHISCTKIWFLQTSMEIPIVKNWRWCDARFFNDFKAAVKLQQHYPGLLKQKNVLRLCRLLLRHVSLLCCSSFWDNKKNPWWWEIWVCLSIRLSQLSKVKSNGKTNKLEGMLSVITEVTCEMQAFPGNSLLISEQLDKIYLTFSLQSKQR